MATFFKLLMILSVFLIRLEVVSAQALPNPAVDETTQRYIDSLIAAGFTVPTDCRLLGQPLSYTDASGAVITGTCCAGLELNGRTNKCDVKEATDEALVSCTPDSVCSIGRACMPQHASHFFSGVGHDITVDNNYELSVMKDAFNSQVGEYASLKSNGDTCTHSSDCQSYSCNAAGKCEEKLVCRKADEGEIPPTGAICGSQLKKNPNTGKCEPDSAMDYAGLYGSLDENEIIKRIRSTDNAYNNTCQFEMTNGAKIRTTVAMQSVRAMEWFLSSISLNVTARHSDNIYNDCFDLANHLKNQIAIPFLTKRKEILKIFSIRMKEYEEDSAKLIKLAEEQQKTLTDFKQEGTDKAVMANEIVIIDGEPITKLELLTRLPSGYDSLMLQYRRNLLFGEYEQQMFSITEEAQKKIYELSEALGRWNNGGPAWPLSDTINAPYYNCQAHYEKYDWHDFDWDDRWHGSTAARWSTYYMVDGVKPNNLEIVKKDTVANTLALITGGLNMLSVDILGNAGQNTATATAESLASANESAIDVKANAINYFNRPHILLDPMLYGKAPSAWGNYGRSVKEGERDYSISFGAVGAMFGTSLGGLFSGGIGGKRYTRRYYVTNGEGNHSYAKIYEDTRAGLLKHYQDLKLDPTQTDFIYEPELSSLKANRDFDKAQCFDNSNKPECAEFNQFLGVVQDQAFAYFLAYSASTQGNYANYFNRHSTWRRRLFGKLSVDLTNLTAYYKRAVLYREEQNECIQQSMDGLDTLGFLPQGADGLMEGGHYYDPTANVKTTKQTSSTHLKPLSKVRDRFNSRFGGGSNRALNGQVIGAGAGSSSNNSGAGSVGSSSSSSISSATGASARFKKMKESNDNAAKLGRNVSEREKSLNDSMKSLAGKTGQGGALGGLSNSSGAGFGKVDAGSPEVSSSGKTVIINNGPEAAGAGVGVGINAGAAGGAGTVLSEGRYGSGGYGMSAGAGNSSGSGSGNLTGLSDEESEKLMSEYERNKKEYRGSDEDGLFSKVSKAYIRNLEKVLKKKKVEP